MKDESQQPWKPELPKLNIQKSQDHHEYGKIFQTNESQQQVPPGQKKLFYRLEFTDCSHDYNHTICRDMQEVQVYLTCDDTDLGNNIEAGGDDDREPKVEIVGVWMTEGEYQQWGKDNSCDLTENPQPSQPGEGPSRIQMERKFDTMLYPEKYGKEPPLPEQGKEEDRLTEVEWAKKSGFLAIVVRVQELEIENSRLKSKPTDGWSDEDMWKLYCDVKTDPNGIDFKTWLSSYKAKQKQ